MTTVNNIHPSEDFLNSLYYEAVDVSTNQAEVYDYIARTAFEAGLNRKIEIAKRIENKQDRSISNLVIRQIQVSNALIERIEFTRTVIRNTLAKMTHGVPEEFSWVYLSLRASFTGIHRKRNNTRPRRKDEDISYHISHGVVLPSPDHLAVFQVGSMEVKLPLSMLGNDPIAIAQMVRKKCRAYAEETIRTQLNELIRKKKDLAETHESEMKKLEKKLEEKRAFSKMKPAGRGARKKQVPPTKVASPAQP